MAIGGLIAERLAPVAPQGPGRASALRAAPMTSARHWLAERSRGEMAAGSVIYHAPSTAFQSPGGGENQLIQTGRYLEAQGVPVRPFCPWTDRLDRSRLLHLFGMSREGLQLARVARAKGVPVVLSPICWIEPRAMAALATDPIGRLANRTKWRLKALVPQWPSWRRELLRTADAILPNSAAEGEQLVRWFGADPRRIRPVPNGVEERFARAEASHFRAIHGPGDFVLYVGRIEPRKNVLGLIEGVHATGLPLVVLGDALPGYEGYAEECRRAGWGFTRWLPRVDHDDPVLESAYAAARVLALPSWFETPGLVALEAALAGTAVVVTPHGCTREYFGSRVGYARPDRPSEIARAVAQAWADGPDPCLSEHVGRHYPWSEVARRTAEAYEQVTR
ncbi:glycosyltransferase family 4 protein [Tundrisphaera lichenicola]|uniref:glycosyltransferase family 4 protein n=1 Tax=Tundrisphaera lichenicola TaxID=2029860 RepID=UPI003EBA5B2A